MRKYEKKGLLYEPDTESHEEIVDQVYWVVNEAPQGRRD